jgi:RNA-directed DNA polymerase
VLDADISKCFDKIDHDKLIAKIDTFPQLRNQIKAWLRSGVFDKGAYSYSYSYSYSPTNAGTPQGGVISPLLTLHCMEWKPT